MNKKNSPFLNREISWLHFNARVLQEVSDKRVPLIARIKFLAIFSSNLDEFYRVRVATLNRLLNLNEKAKEVFGFNPKKLLNEIKNIVVKQEKKFELLYQKAIKELAENKIFITSDSQLLPAQASFVRNYFRDYILSNLVPVMVNQQKAFPMLKDRSLYFFVKFSNGQQPHVKEQYALLEIPTTISRFLVLPEAEDARYIILLEDVIRFCLDDIFYIFQYEKIEGYTIQLTRDAELDIDAKISEKFIEALKSSIEKRKSGKPMRLLYDSSMPLSMLNLLIDKLKLAPDNLIPGNRYHRFGDFIDFPNVGSKELEYKVDKPLKINGLHRTESIFNKMLKKDYMVHLPYQSYDYIILFLREAAIDVKVVEIQITLYRLAENSKVINALINAARNGKKVSVLVELKARFDEQANLFWVDRLKEGGVEVKYGLSDYKVHCKTCLVKRVDKGKIQYFATLGTGNFNEKTARLYCDHNLFTTNKTITKDLVKLFEALAAGKVAHGFKSLWVSPLESRKHIYKLIQREIKNAKNNKPASILFKVNSLADEGVIHKLYEASRAGVKIKLIVRGICCLVPGVPGFSDNIEAISIIDKYLEHARMYVFGNGGQIQMYLSSADLMTRNLDHRVEVGFPILDESIKNQLLDILKIQWSDNTKARWIDAQNTNKYRKDAHHKKVRAQLDTYLYLKSKC